MNLFLLNRYSKCILDLEKIVAQFYEDNDETVTAALKACPDNQRPEIERYLRDTIHSVTSKNHISLRISLFNCEELMENLSLVLQTLTIPYRIKIDMGYTAWTPDNDIYIFHPSRNSALDLPQIIIKDSDSIINLMKSIGWYYQLEPIEERDDSLLIQKTIDRHDALFSIYTTSKFRLGTIFFMEIYVSCDVPLLTAWKG